MRATEFEYRHQSLVHQLIVGAAFLTYLAEPDDVVWSLVKDGPSPHPFERAFFILAALLIAIGAAICTRARTLRETNSLRYRGEFLYALGLGSLVPISGFVILIAGEGLRLTRLALRDDALSSSSSKVAFRREAVKWCVLLAMIVFVITLNDRVVEILLVVSLVAGWAFNPPFWTIRKDRE